MKVIINSKTQNQEEDHPCSPSCKQCKSLIGSCSLCIFFCLQCIEQGVSAASAKNRKQKEEE